MQPALIALAQCGLRFDALIQPRHLPALRTLAARHKALRIVIDHAAKPAIAQGAFEPWASDIARVARDTDACCKLSGLVTEAAPDWRHPDWNRNNLRRTVDQLIGCLGPSRLTLGSDWPVAKLAGGAVRRRASSRRLLADLDTPSRDAILSAIAGMFHDLGEAT